MCRFHLFLRCTEVAYWRCWLSRCGGLYIAEALGIVGPSVIIVPTIVITIPVRRLNVHQAELDFFTIIVYSTPETAI